MFIVRKKNKLQNYSPYRYFEKFSVYVTNNRCEQNDFFKAKFNYIRQTFKKWHFDVYYKT